MKKIFIKRIITVIIAIAAVHTMAIAETLFWYDRPAAFWTEALPLGNGRLGAMVYGGVQSDTIRLNECSFWTGAPYNRAEAGCHAMNYETVGNVVLSFPTHRGESNYRRELNVDDAIARVSYDAGGVTYDREVLTSFSDDVTLIRVRASKKGALSFSVAVSGPQNKTRIKSAISRTEGSIDELRLYTVAATPDTDGVPNGLRCVSLFKVLTVDGKCVISGNQFNITDATEALIAVSSATNYVSYCDITGDADQKARLTMNKFMAKGLGLQKFNVLESEHKSLYHKQYDKVKLTVGVSGDDVKKTTDRRVMNFASSDDARLVTDFFQYGRYLLICSSQKGGVPANGQGVWSQDAGATPNGTLSYDLACTLPETYWASESANLTAAMSPYVDMICQLSAKGIAMNAKSGQKGWAAPRFSDAWYGASSTDEGNIAYSALLCNSLWDAYLYSGDRRYMSNVAFPVMADACRYYIANGVKADEKVQMNNQLLYDLYYNTRQAAETIASSMWGDAAAKLVAFADSLDNARMALPAISVDGNGVIAQNAGKNEVTALHNLWCAYPGCQVSAYQHPELWSAVQRTLIEMGDGGTSAQLAWKACLWARLLNGDHAYRMILSMLNIKDPHAAMEYGHSGGIYPNMVCGNPEFGIAGNLGCVAAMTEMLVQSHDGTMNLLPALPTAWADGEVSGLRCRGGYEIVKMKWANGYVSSVTIRSTVGGTLRLRSNTPLHMAGGRDLTPAAEGSNNNLLLKKYEILKPVIEDPSKIIEPELDETYVYDIPTNPGTEYTFVK